jgi:hypothetical protein
MNQGASCAGRRIENGDEQTVPVSAPLRLLGLPQLSILFEQSASCFG